MISQRRLINEILILNSEVKPIGPITYESLCLESEQFFAITDRLFLLMEKEEKESWFGKLTKKGKAFINKLGGDFKKKFNEIKELAETAAMGIKDMISVLKAKDGFLFKLFGAIGWQFDQLKTMIQNAKKHYAKFREALVGGLAGIPGFKQAIEGGKVAAKQVDEWMKKYPILKKIGGPIIAAILVFIWMNMSFTGDWDSDFDLTPMLKAMMGEFDIAELFLSKAGIEMLGLLALGMGTTLSFPWLTGISGTARLAVAFVYTIGKIVLNKTFGKDKSDKKDEEDIDKKITAKKTDKGILVPKKAEDTLKKVGINVESKRYEKLIRKHVRLTLLESMRRT